MPTALLISVIQTYDIHRTDEKRQIQEDPPPIWYSARAPAQLKFDPVLTTQPSERISEFIMIFDLLMTLIYIYHRESNYLHSRRC